MRKDARETVYKLLFADMFNKGLEKSFVQYMYREAKLNENDIEFAQNLLNAVISHYDEIYSEITETVKNYNTDRLYAADKCALLIAMTEMKYFDDIPLVVSIDEAVSLVGKYSTENSLAFVNGILAEYKKKLEATPDGDN